MVHDCKVVYKSSLEIFFFKNDPTGIPRLVHFFGPQETAILEKPH